jgi:hypothetical protein
MDPRRRALYKRMNEGLAVIAELPDIITSVILVDNTEAYKEFRILASHVSPWTSNIG